MAKRKEKKLGLSGALPRHLAERVKAEIAGYATSAQSVIVAPSKLLRDPKSGVEIAAANDDRGPFERLAHDVIGLEGGHEQMRHARVLSATPLDRMLHRAELAQSKKGDHRRLWNAGDRFRSDYQLVYAEPRVVADLTGVRAGGGAQVLMHDGRLAAQRRLKRVEAAVGRMNYWLLREVCARDRPPTEVLAFYGITEPRHPMPVFRWALEALAQHYGY